MRYEIRAMSFGEILDTGFHLLRNHFMLLVGIGAAIYVPYAFLDAYLSSNLNLVAAGGLPVLIGILLGVLFLLLISPIASAGVTFAIGEVYLGREPSVRESLSAGVAIYVPLASTTLIAGLFTFGGLLLLVVPGIYALLALMLIWQVAVLEHTFGMAALRRSRVLMRGNLWRGFGLLSVGGLIVTVLSASLDLIVHPIPILGPLASGLAQAAGAAYTSAVAVLLYFDIRCRKESFDVEHLAHQVEADQSVTPRPVL